MKKAIFILLLLAGCDDSTLMANVDTYTCALLPNAVDCTLPEIHDKAISVLTHGAIESFARCVVDSVPYAKNIEDLDQTPWAVLDVQFEAAVLQDGTVFTNCHMSSFNHVQGRDPLDSWKSFHGSSISPRNEASPNSGVCYIQGYGMDNARFEVNEGEFKIHFPYWYSGISDVTKTIAGNCFGFNLEYFD